MVDLLSNFSEFTGIYTFMNSPWGWPTAESIHFLGLAMLIGTVGVFDLRMLGIGRGIAYLDMHKLVKIGVLGYFLNLMTGIMFLTTAPGVASLPALFSDIKYRANLLLVEEGSFIILALFIAPNLEGIL